MNPEDIEAVIEVIEFIDDDDAAYARADLMARDRAGAWREDDHRYFVWDGEDEGIIGVCGAVEDDEEGEDIWWLGWCYVHPAFQGQGIGTALLSVVLEWVRGAGGRKIYVDVSNLDMYAAARQFYECHGFQTEGRLIDYYEPGEDQIIMGRGVDLDA